jgi:hypothetical protein
MSLYDLPVELQLTIAESLDPKSCFNFACTSHERFHTCASLVARHKQYWERYNTIDAGDHDAGRLIWDVTKEILEEERRVAYIKDISLPGRRQPMWDGDAGSPASITSASSQVPEDYVQIYMAAVRKDLDLYGTTWDMEGTVRVGAGDPILAILLLRASELHTLRYTDAGTFTHELFQVIKGIAMTYSDPARCLSLPFQKLTYVAIAHHDSEMSCYAAWAKVFLAVPSLKGFAAHMMGGTLDSANYADSLLQSNVKSILFHYSFFHPEAIEDILQGTEALKYFFYENGGAIVSDEGCFAPRRVMKALVEHAGHSLEELILERDEIGLDDDEIDNVSLHGFQKLRVLRCSWNAIFHDIDSGEEDEYAELPEGAFYTETSRERRDLDTRFPRSLQTLHLEGNAPEAADWRALITILREADTHLPNLRQIWVRGDEKQNEELFAVIKERGLEYKEESGMYEHPLSKLLGEQGYT